MLRDERKRWWDDWLSSEPLDDEPEDVEEDEGLLDVLLWPIV